MAQSPDKRRKEGNFSPFVRNLAVGVNPLRVQSRYCRDLQSLTRSQRDGGGPSRGRRRRWLPG